MALTHGHDAVFRYIEETTAGTFPTNPALILPSKQVRRVRFFLDKNLKEALDIDDYEVDSHYSVTNAYGLEIEYVVYDVDRVTEFWDRNSDGTTNSYSVEILPNQSAATKHYMRGTGWRPQTCRLSGSVDGEYIHTVTFVGGKFTTAVTADPGVGSGSREAKSAITDAIRTFSSGAITLNGSAWAVLLEDFELTIDHGSTAHYTTGDDDPVPGATTYGMRKISGSATFSIDDGAKTHFDLVDALSTHSIVVPFSTTAGQPKITLGSVVFPRLEVELGAETDVLMGSQPFNAETFTVGTV